MSGHSSERVANLVAVSTTEGNRVIAVQWETHDPLSCDGTDLEIDTSGFLCCPSSGCRWMYDPESRCPVHGTRGDA
jgi:hypothetical protein